MVILQRILPLIPALVLSGCVISEIKPEEYTPAVQAQAEVPEDRLLDVGIALFDSNLPKTGDDPGKASSGTSGRRNPASSPTG